MSNNDANINSIDWEVRTTQKALRSFVWKSWCSMSTICLRVGA